MTLEIQKSKMNCKSFKSFIFQVIGTLRIMESLAFLADKGMFDDRILVLDMSTDVSLSQNPYNN